MLKHNFPYVTEKKIKYRSTGGIAGIVKTCGLTINDLITYSLKKVDDDKGKHIICHSL